MIKLKPRTTGGTRSQVAMQP